MCSLTLRPGVDALGISLQPDRDFGHIIKQVDPSSPAARAGIERDDCIMTLNDTSLLNIPYDDVLSILKQSRNENNLDFLVAKKSYLLKSRQNNATVANLQQHDSPGRYTESEPTSTGQVLPSSNISTRNNSSSLPATQALEQLYNKYTNDQRTAVDEPASVYRPKETVSSTTTVTERYDHLSPQLDREQYSTKPQQQGQILRGVGPATADGASWRSSGEKVPNEFPTPVSGDASIRSNSRGQRTGSFRCFLGRSTLETSLSIVVFLPSIIASTYSKWQRRNLYTYCVCRWVTFDDRLNLALAMRWSLS